MTVEYIVLSFFMIINNPYISLYKGLYKDYKKVLTKG